MLWVALPPSAPPPHPSPALRSRLKDSHRLWVTPPPCPHPPPGVLHSPLSPSTHLKGAHRLRRPAGVDPRAVPAVRAARRQRRPPRARTTWHRPRLRHSCELGRQELLPLLLPLRLLLLLHLLRCWGRGLLGGGRRRSGLPCRCVCAGAALSGGASSRRRRRAANHVAPGAPGRCRCCCRCSCGW